MVWRWKSPEQGERLRKNMRDAVFIGKNILVPAMHGNLVDLPLFSTLAFKFFIAYIFCRIFNRIYFFHVHMPTKCNFYLLQLHSNQLSENGVSVGLHLGGTNCPSLLSKLGSSSSWSSSLYLTFKVDIGNELLLAFLLFLGPAQIISISLETSMQNGAVPYLVLSLTFSSPYAELGSCLLCPSYFPPQVPDRPFRNFRASISGSYKPYVVTIRRSTECKALNLWKGRSAMRNTTGLKSFSWCQAWSLLCDTFVSFE